jgi:hypothetical protein
MTFCQLCVKKSKKVPNSIKLVLIPTEKGCFARSCTDVYTLRRLALAQEDSIECSSASLMQSLQPNEKKPPPRLSRFA